MAVTLYECGAAAIEPPSAVGATEAPALLDNFVDNISASPASPGPPDLDVPTNTPVVVFPFSSTISYYTDIQFVLPQTYVVTTSIIVKMKVRVTAGAGENVFWGTQMKATSDTELGTRAFAAAQEGNEAAPTPGAFKTFSKTLTNAASNLDGAVAGDLARFRIYREKADALAGSLFVVRFYFET